MIIIDFTLDLGITFTTFFVCLLVFCWIYKTLYFKSTEQEETMEELEFDVDEAELSFNNSFAQESFDKEELMMMQPGS